MNLNLDSRYEDKQFVAMYAAVWAFGYLNGFGAGEGLYRTVSSIACTALRQMNEPTRVLDIGCGVGRTCADIAEGVPTTSVRGIDQATEMIRLAKRIVQGKNHVVILDVASAGFGQMAIRTLGLKNVRFIKARYESMSCREVLQTSRYHLVTAVNTLDRCQDPSLFLRAVRRMLIAEGTFVLATPLNFRSGEHWRKFIRPSKLKQELLHYGFRIRKDFDGLIYRETLDARGSVCDFNTRVIECVLSR